MSTLDLHQQLYEVEAAFTSSTFKHGARRQLDSTSPLLERWVQDHVYADGTSPRDSLSPKNGILSKRQHHTYHSKLQAAPSQTGNRASLRMTRGRLSQDFAKSEDDTNRRGGGGGGGGSGGGGGGGGGVTSRRSCYRSRLDDKKINSYQRGNSSKRSVRETAACSNQSRSQPRSHASCSTAHSPTSPTSPQRQKRRHKTTLAEFGRSLMSSKHIGYSGSTVVNFANTSSSSVAHAPATSSNSANNNKGHLHASLSRMRSFEDIKKIQNQQILGAMQENRISSGSAVAKSMLHTDQNASKESAQVSTKALSPTTSESGASRSPRSWDKHCYDAHSPSQRSVGSRIVSISGADDETFGADMAIKIVQHHKDVTPTAKLDHGLRRIAGTGRTPLVLVAFGALNPVHLNHLRMFQTARSFIEKNTEFGVIGGYLCPAHDKYVRSKCRAAAAQAIPAKHRVRLCQLMVRNSSWIDCNRWEVTRNTGFLDYPTVLEHCHAYMLGTLGPAVRTMYLCGIDELAKLAPDVLQNYGAICVMRFSDERAIREAKKIRRRSGGQVYIAEDHDIIHTALATANSTRVRKLLIQNANITELMGPDCLKYCKSNAIGRKLAGKIKWTGEDRDIEGLFGHESVYHHSNTEQGRFEPSGRGLYEETGPSAIRRIAVDPDRAKKKRQRRARRQENDADVLVEHGHNKTYILGRSGSIKSKGVAESQDSVCAQQATDLSDVTTLGTTGHNRNGGDR